ncbi:nucleotidyltransferase family protein [bacterium]|nr:nucleotidyltransferase family protein [bacterium]
MDIFALRREILEICAKHGCSNVRVFGSYARGEATGDSDLDLLVELTGSRTPWWPGGLIVDLEKLLGIEIDVVTPDALHRRIKDAVLAEAVQL